MTPLLNGRDWLRFRRRTLLLLLFIFISPGTVSPGLIPDRQTIFAEIGGNVTLPCSAKRYMPLEQIEWSRPGTHLQYVVIFRTQSQDLEIPERYEGRVDLKDRENGDASLVLKNVTAEDGGTYECYAVRDTGRSKRDIQPVSTVYLDVHYPPPLGYRSSIAAVVAACVVMAVIVSLMVVAVIRRKKINNYRPSAQDEAETSQIA